MFLNIYIPVFASSIPQSSVDVTTEDIIDTITTAGEDVTAGTDVLITDCGPPQHCDTSRTSPCPPPLLTPRPAIGAGVILQIIYTYTCYSLLTSYTLAH